MGNSKLKRKQSQEDTRKAEQRSKKSKHKGQQKVGRKPKLTKKERKAVAKLKSPASTTGWYYLMPLVLAVAVVPLIVYMRIIPLEGAAFEFWTGEKQNTDFFSYYKGIGIIVAAAAALLVLLVRGFYQEKITFKPTQLYIPLAVYAFFILVSAVFAEHRTVAMYGFPDRYEGMWVLISYLVLMFAAVNLVSEKKHVKIILGALFVSAVIIGVIGVFQYIGHDFFRTDFGRSLILPAEFHHLKEQLNFHFGAYTIYSTLYNTNFVGSYMAMLLAVSMITFIFSKSKKVKLGLGLVSALMFLNLIGSNSRAGILAAVVTSLVLLVILRRQVLRNWYYVLASLFCAVLLLFALNTVTEGRFIDRARTLLDWDRLFAAAAADPNRPQEVIMDGEKVTITTYGNSINFYLQENNLLFSGSEGERLDFVLDQPSGQITFNDEKYANFNFTFLENNMLRVQTGRVTKNFRLTAEGIRFINHRGQEVILEPVPSWGFTGMEAAGSSRGYIWSRSIPLLKNTFFVGHGPDTFAIYFPQHDYIGKANWLRSMGKVVDKPHNLYLQVGINTGVISLLALLSLFGMYTVQSFALYFNRRDYSDLFASTGLAIFAAFCGYAVAALFNDSVVSVAPVFWVLLGLGVACNYKIKSLKA